MEFRHWLLNEMPINQFQLLGNWEEKAPKYGFDKPSIGILQSPKGVEKIKKSWSNSEVDFNVYFLRSKEGYNTFRVGEYTSEQIKNYLKIDIPKPQDDSINIVFTNNVGADRMPMTAWIIAHRLSHAMFNHPRFQDYIKNVNNSLKNCLLDYYTSMPVSQNDIFSFVKQLATFKSARENKLVNMNEFFHELAAQWIISKIKFNPLPTKFTTYGAKFSRRTFILQSQDAYELNGVKESLERDIDYHTYSLFGSMVNKIFVF